jgi:hypothetical protein
VSQHARGEHVPVDLNNSRPSKVWQLQVFVICIAFKPNKYLFSGREASFVILQLMRQLLTPKDVVTGAEFPRAGQDIVHL